MKDNINIDSIAIWYSAVIIAIYHIHCYKGMEMEIPQRIMGKGSGSSGHLLNTTLADEPKFIPINLGFKAKHIAISSTFTLALSQEG